MFNIMNIVGRAGQDPEVRYFDSGACLTTFSVAVNRRKKDDKPDWFKVEAWGALAEIAGNYIKKGSLVGIVGSFFVEEWEGADGTLQVAPKIKVMDLDLLSNVTSQRQEPENNFSDSW